MRKAPVIVLYFLSDLVFLSLSLLELLRDKALRSYKLALESNLELLPTSQSASFLYHHIGNMSLFVFVNLRQQATCEAFPLDSQ